MSSPTSVSRERAAVFFQDTCHCTPPLIYAVDFEGVFAGYVIFHDYDDNSMEIGWILHRKMWGKGIATQLTAMLIEKSRSLGKSAVIECHPNQYATKHIAHKFGFVYADIREGCEVYRLSFC